MSRPALEPMELFMSKIHNAPGPLKVLPPASIGSVGRQPDGGLGAVSFVRALPND